MSLTDFLRSIIDMLNASGIEHMLSGSIGAAYHAQVRTTQDIDCVIEATEVQIEELVAAGREAGFYVDREVALSAMRSKTQFNMIDPGRGWKADFIFRKNRPFSREEFRRRAPATLLGIDTWVTTVEDLILAKMEWAVMGDSELQRQDIRGLIQAAGDALDREYIEKWVDEIGVREEWKGFMKEQNPG